MPTLISSKMYRSELWTYQHIEQVDPDTVPVLPAPESFKDRELFMILCKNLKICMRPWIRKLGVPTLITLKN